MTANSETIEFRAFGRLRRAKKIAEIGTTLDVVLYRYPSRDVAELIKVMRPKTDRAGVVGERSASRLSAEDVARVRLLEWTPALRSAVREAREDWVVGLRQMIQHRERLLAQPDSQHPRPARKIAIQKRLATFRAKLEQIERVRHDAGRYIRHGKTLTAQPPKSGFWPAAARCWPFEVRRSRLGLRFHVCDRRKQPDDEGSSTILAQSVAETDDVDHAQREADTRNREIGREVGEEAVGPKAGSRHE